MNERKGIYIGDDFPEYIGEKITVRDFDDNPNAPSYSIKFDGESCWHDDFDDDDIEFID